jgi:aminoglycoside phosphotransferase (APT) family kinase protein
VRSALGPGAEVTAVRPLRGGTSAAVHALDVRDGSGRRLRLVLRRHLRADWLAEEPDLAEREALALRLLRGSGLPVPELVAYDADGSEAGAPAVLMTRLAGHPVYVPADLDAWTGQMASVLPVLHSQALSPELPAYFRYHDLESVGRPSWMGPSPVWEAMVQVLREGAPPAPAAFVHRDYHPANLLWRRGRLSGVVDWVNACRGPAGVDPGHCRVNLVILHGVSVAERFREAYEAAAGVRQHPYWDLVSLADSGIVWGRPDLGYWRSIGGRGLTAPLLAGRLEEYVRVLLARL